ncbi:MAG: ATP-dependent DNA helicase [Opitutales bacterium]|nr:ATP-dependent DNA helicase [Opitutales bacterium]
MNVHEALQKYFGFGQFLEAQQEIVESILNGRDTLVVKPTGGGKSLCYQLPALIKEGVTMVVSPLIALMKDQVDALDQKNIPATFINSTLSQAEYRERIEGMEVGRYKLIYVAPERFRAEGFMRRMQNVPISFFAVDEAHCLSQWGHDFRPDYLRLGRALKALGHPQVAAFTATATPEVRADIETHLELRDPRIFVAGFSRPNLSLRINQVGGEGEKMERILDLVRKNRVGIVYCATRKKVESVADQLRAEKVPLVAYHGGMDDKAREAAQTEFMTGKADVAVATNAFGMGIDRADIRFVVHYQVPGSVEAYYQEAGRAGRDGEPAVCELLFNFADTKVQEFFIEGSNPSLTLIQQVYRELRNLRDEGNEVFLSNQELIDKFEKGTNPMAVNTSLSVLVRNRIIERFDIPGKRIRGSRLLNPDLAPADIPLDREALEEKERRDRSKLQAMISMAYSRDCRQAWIRSYFGEPDPEECGNCDACRRYESHLLRDPTPEEKEILVKALSGVARMCNRVGQHQWEGRFGRGRVVQMLLGSRSQEIISAGLDQLSTYGLLRKEGAKYVNELFREMEESGLIEVAQGRFPLLFLTEKGHRAMTGAEEVRLSWPSRQKKTKKVPSEAFALSADGTEQPPSQEEDELFDRLKEVRKEIAREQNVPVYVVFTNQTLRELARNRPRTKEDAIGLPGIGPAKAARFLNQFIEEMHG